MKTVLITGASSGIGYELAHVFARNKFNLVMVARSEDKLKQLQKNLIEKHAVLVDIFGLDLSVMSNIDTLCAGLQAKGIGVDILVNNAGFGDFGIFYKRDWKKEEMMLNLNINALTYLTRLFLPMMVKNKYGKILNVASVAAFMPGPLMSVYHATKAYVLSFSMAIANELKGSGVTVTTLCPGPTVSGFQDAASLGDSVFFKGKRVPTSAMVAEFGYKALMKGKLKAVHGFIYKMMVFFIPFFSVKFITSTARKLQEK
jgi:short-subunit dehydrogenase